MLTQFKKFTVAVIFTMFAQVATAAEYQITVTGTVVKDMFSLSFHGITDASVPYSLSFIVNDSAIVQRPAGASVIGGKGFTTSSYLIPASAIQDFVFSIGNQTYTRNDLMLLNLGDSGLSYHILLLGQLSEDNITGVRLTFANSQGSFSIGEYSCLVTATTCNFFNANTAESYVEGSFADVITGQVSSQSLVPQASADDLIEELSKSIGKNKSIKALQKLAFQLELAAAALLVKKGKIVQAQTAIKAFIVTVQALVKCKTLSAAVGNELIDAAKDILDAL